MDTHIMALARKGEVMSNRKDEFARTIRQRIQQLNDLPTLPEAARALLRLRNDPQAGTQELATVVEQDPSLAAQIVRYARLSIFGYGGKVTSVQKAITLVLGFDMALHMALGLATGNRLNMPEDGRIGRNAFWRHAVYSATLMQEFSTAIPAARRPPAGITYLAGLLHNLGFVTLSHLAPKEFTLLNQFFSESGANSTRELELQLLGVRHEQLGMWLMQAWGLPEEVIITAREHHYPDYEGHHSTYSKLALLADRALARHQLGDDNNCEMPKEILASLGLTETWTLAKLEQLFTISSELDSLVEQLAA